MVKVLLFFKKNCCLEASSLLFAKADSCWGRFFLWYGDVCIRAIQRILQGMVLISSKKSIVKNFSGSILLFWLTGGIFGMRFCLCVDFFSCCELSIKGMLECLGKYDNWIICAILEEFFLWKMLSSVWSGDGIFMRRKFF